MRSTRSRIEALERVHGFDADDINVIIKHFHTRPDGESPSAFSTPEPEVRCVHRDPGESDDAFHDRAIAVLRGRKRGLFVMQEDCQGCQLLSAVDASEKLNNNAAADSIKAV